MRRTLSDNRTRSANLLRSLEVATELSDTFVRDVNNRRVELQAEQPQLEEHLAAAEDEVRTAVNPNLLDSLPVVAVDLDQLPDEVSRPLFEALHLEVRYDCETRCAVYGKAAFDAVGPLLLIGWAEVGPSLLQAMSSAQAELANLAQLVLRCPVRTAPVTEAAVVDELKELHEQRVDDDELSAKARRADARHWLDHK